VVSFAANPDLQLPWSSSERENTRFRRLLRNFLIIFLMLAVVIPFLPVKEISREEKEALPPQLARVILEKKELPKPPEPEKKPEEKPKEEPKPEEPKVAEKPVEKPEPKPQPVDLVKQAKATAAVSGLMAFQDDLADMRDSLNVDVPTSNLTQSNATEAKVERSLIAAKAKTASGGIQTAALSRDTGGAALSAKEDTKVEGPLTGVAEPQQGQVDSGEVAGGRSDESIRRLMDQNKGAIFAIYNRALRQDPTLQGKYVFELLIEPDGSISEAKLLSSELGDAELDRKILSRVRLIRFPAENVIKTRVNYSFDFLPY
jgi:outer membrane biosynthesis protein TonB